MTVWKLVTPKMLEMAQTQFSCTTLNGVEIESEGGTGTAGSHWEQRIYYNELMAGVSTPGPVLSNITLGYLYDTGHYVPEFSVAATLTWGHRAGCDFATQKCLTP